MSAAALSGETIDISRLPPPDIIEALGYETLNAEFLARFQAAWTAARTVDPSLPVWNLPGLETDPAVILAQAWAFLRLLDRARVNDAARAVLAPLAKGADLDAVAARVNVARLTVIPAAGDAPAVMETDARLLTRYLLAFSRPAAGSREGYLFDVYTALPILHHAEVVGRAIHGRRGDVDVVLAGPNGRDLTDPELAVCRAAITAPNRKPEAVAVTALRAQRLVYDVAGSMQVAKGPDPEAVRLEAVSRLRAEAAARMRIGALVPVNALSGAIYGAGVVSAEISDPAEDVAASRYAIPILGDLDLTAEAAT